MIEKSTKLKKPKKAVSISVTDASVTPTARKRAPRMSPDERREQLLSCAVKCFAQNGLSNANHAMVAEMAGVSVATVFFYFETREALVEAALNEVSRLFLTLMEITSNQEGPADVVMRNIGETMTRTLSTHPDHARVLMEWSVSVRSSIWQKYLRMYKKLNKMMAKVCKRGQEEGIFRTDIDAEDEAAILHAGSTAIIQMVEIGASQTRLDSFQRAVIQSVLIQPTSAMKTSTSQTDTTKSKKTSTVKVTTAEAISSKVTTPRKTKKTRLETEEIQAS